ncbi:ATP-binding protein [Candidatus Micrarchaeota archaeon]|nr:ATP-binding protein [Candidatus Micrarchaeota archaeon]MBU1165488.1 ATP-binding protein [Candidatus Micrarchaeota archaeon]MBU1886326.1 ATP-binding protein [Candidatus Micrarchaeota archaeon]
MAKIPDYQSTKDVIIPKDPFERIIGQDESVAIAKMVPYQRRHLLLVGPPGTGKSMIAQAIASVLPPPTIELSVLENQENQDKPIIEIRSASQIQVDKNSDKQVGAEVSPLNVPSFVAERLGFRCRRCGALSAFTESMCPQCGAAKIQRGNIFEGYLPPQMDASPETRMRVATTRRAITGKEEIIIYERTTDGKILMLRQDEIKKLEEMSKKSKRKVIVPLKRSCFVQATGGTETELLGDIRHDPYGGHQNLGTPVYQRVVPGAVHEAHEGVLFIDELSTLGEIQRYILTAMQDKAFSIVGRNPMSSGAAARVDMVPCDFLFVGACNINDVKQITPPLRSRIRGDGYEVLMNAYMEDTLQNQEKTIQFIAQEIIKDGKIPHADTASISALIEESKAIARKIDNAKGLTLRLRNLAGIIKMAGDMATMQKKELIEKKDVIAAIKEARPIEEKVREKYGSWWAVEAADHGMKNEKAGPETA